MGGVCPCLAGVEKAAGGTAPGPASNVQLQEKASDAKKTAPANVAPAPAAVEPPQPPTETMPLLSKDSAVATAESGAPEGGLGIGDCLEVYSNSYGAWCPGVIQASDSTSVLLAYQVPGEPVDANISTKTLALDSSEIRLPTDDGSWLTASVEVYSHSNKAWCLGKVTEINAGLLNVVFFYPNEPPDAVPVMKQLAFRDTDLRLRGIDAALGFNPNGGVGHENLQVGGAVEVYSNSLAFWCSGIVHAIDEGVVNVHFYYPDMDPSTEQPAVKDLPLGHQDLRLPGFATGAHYLDSGPPITEADIKVGGKLEVFSASRQVWLLSEIKDMSNQMVTVQLRYPDMPDDSDLFEKVLPLGHQDMRLPVDGSA